MIYNYSESKNKTYVQEGNSYLSFKKYYKIKNKENIENKKDNNKKHISLLNELMKMNKKEKNQNIIAMKKNLNNQSLKINKQNLTQINIHKDNI